MPTKSVVVGSAVGLHARPAAIISEAAGELDSGRTDKIRQYVEQYDGGECFFVTPVAISDSAAVLVWENRWAAPFAAAVRRSGGQLVASGRIPVQALLAALDAAEAQAEA